MIHDGRETCERAPVDFQVRKRLVRHQPDIPIVAARPFTFLDERVEREIAHFMCELLRVDRVARDDDFFELGGHSMSVLRLCSHIRVSFAVDVPTRLVFARPTLEAIAGFVEAALLLTRGSGVRVASLDQEREEVLL